MHAPTLMPLAHLKTDTNEKENTLQPGALSALDGAKALMHNYWDRNKKNSHDYSTKDYASKTF